MATWDQFNSDPAQNTKAPPLGAPEGGLANKQISDTFRQVMAAVREVGDIASDIENASETARGIIELATAAEVLTGTDTVRAVTPAGLAGRTATLTRAGIVELATGPETLAGADTVRAVTPAGLASVIEDIVLGQVPPASTTVAGVVELATNAEAQTGTDTARAVTPAALAAVTATATRAGLVELATNAEVATGTDTVRAVTPAGLASVLVDASATVAGLVELATTAETTTGSDATRAITPAGLAGTVSIGNPGYINWPGSLVIRYGFATTTTGGQRTITFGAAFANAVNCLQLTTLSDTGNYSCRVSAVTTSAFTAQLFDTDAAAAPSGVTFYWLAIGG
jgi:hypothetical protein